MASPAPEPTPKAPKPKVPKVPKPKAPGSPFANYTPAPEPGFTSEGTNTVATAGGETGKGVVAIFLLLLALLLAVIAVRGTYKLTYEAIKNAPNAARESGGPTEPHGPHDPGPGKSS